VPVQLLETEYVFLLVSVKEPFEIVPAALNPTFKVAGVVSLPLAYGDLEAMRDEKSTPGGEITSISVTVRGTICHQHNLRGQ